MRSSLPAEFTHEWHHPLSTTLKSCGGISPLTTSNLNLHPSKCPHHPHQTVKLYNSAAWLPAENAQLQVSSAPFPTPGDDELVIRSHAITINPVDWKTQTYAGFMTDYPAILGSDLAGKIFQVGANLQGKFRPGQRVIRNAAWKSYGTAFGGFQKYPVLKGAMVSLIPDDISFSDAVVLPLSISTAAAGLFFEEALGLKLPEVVDELASSNFETAGKKQTLLAWGGPSSVGSSVIQLAAASGYTVITTASASNFEYCKGLGAASVLDYHDPEIVPALIDLLKGTDTVGAYDAIGDEDTVRQCAGVLGVLGGGRIASVGSVPTDLGKGVEVVRIAAGNIGSHQLEVGQRIWGEYVSWALRSGKLIASRVWIDRNGGLVRGRWW